MLGQREEMKIVFLGYKSKKLESYKKEMAKIRICIVCGSEIAEGGSYGELGYIVRRKFEERSVWCYEFTKLCPDCFGGVWRLAKLREPVKEEVIEEIPAP